MTLSHQRHWSLSLRRPIILTAIHLCRIVGRQEIKNDNARMASNYAVFGVLFSLFMASSSSSSATTFLSDRVFESHGSNSRSLLQAKKSCAINFESQNYTIITSQCKGPQYPPQACCQAFKEFACPFTDAINDEQSDCATTMFSYINLYGKYPPGLFALQCREGKEGLDCTDILAAKQKSRAQISATPPAMLLLLTTFSLLVYHLF